MKKALWLIAAVALVMVTGCDSEALDIDKFPSGSDNLNFSGKTFTQAVPTTVSSIYKYTNAAAGTTMAETQDTIKLATSTTTIVFNSDGTFTKTTTASYTGAADGEYVNAGSVSYSTQYNLTGFNNKVFYTEVETGTWYQYKDKVSDAVDVTNILMMDTLENVRTNNYDNFGPSTTVRTYTAGEVYVDTERFAPGNPSAVTYYYAGENADGDDMYSIGGTKFIVQ